MQNTDDYGSNILIYNPPSPEGQIIMRSYSGGFGDIEDAECLENALDIIVFPPIELLMIAENLRKGGHRITFTDYQTQSYVEEKFIKLLKEQHFNLVISSVSLPTYRNDCNIAALCKRYSQAKVFIHSSVTYEDFVKEVLHVSGCDAVIFPNALMDICDIIKDFAGRPNVAYLNPHLTMLTQIYIGSMDKYPVAARDLVDNTNYKFPFMYDCSIPNITTMHSSYGCPYPCHYYCPYPLSEGRQFRALSSKRVVEELHDIQKKGLKAVIFRDPLFTFDKERVMDICRQIIDLRIDLMWWCETRIDCLDEELLTTMKEAHCVGIEVGVETGDETVMINQAKYGLTLNKLYTFKELADKIGLHIQYLFMVGLPKESVRSITKTIKLILDLGLNKNEYNISSITPYLGTPLYYEATEKGWITNKWDNFTGYSVVMRTDNLSLEQMRQSHIIIDKLDKLIQQKGQIPEAAWQEQKNNFISEIDEWSTINADSRSNYLE